MPNPSSNDNNRANQMNPQSPFYYMARGMVAPAAAAAPPWRQSFTPASSFGPRAPMPRMDPMPRRVLLVDDILDEGLTLLAVRQWCLEQGATDVRIAALTVKRHDRAVAEVSADYVGVEVPDRYVFGFGMDVHEHLRNLPAIYAMKVDA